MINVHIGIYANRKNLLRNYIIDFAKIKWDFYETLIFKGSQYLEWIIEKLLLDPRDAKKLCRRDRGAQRRRKAWGLK